MNKFKVGDRVQVNGYPQYSGVIVELPYNDNNLVTVLSNSLERALYHVGDIELVKAQSQELKEYEHYKYSYKGIKLDPYRILDIYKITCPAQQHAIKKLLRAGNSVKELKQDITEVIDTLKRKLEMLEEEDSDNP